MSQDASCAQLRTIVGMVVNLGSTFIKRSQLAKKCMALLLRTILHIPQETFAHRMKSIYTSDPVLGAEACSWGMRVMSWTTPPGKDRDFFLDQMSRADRDAATMRRLKSGWQQYGMPPMDVVNHRPAPQIPRYNSEPIFRSTRTERRHRSRERRHRT